MREFEPVFNDVMGTRLPYDYSYQGQEAFIDYMFTRFNELVYELCASVPQQIAGVPGINVDGDVGTLMVTEGKTFPVWITFPYAAKAVFGGNSMPAGYRFFACLMKGPDRHRSGTGVRKIGVHFHATRVYVPPTAGTVLVPIQPYSPGSPPGGLVSVVTNPGLQLLYDFNTTGLPAVN